MGRYRYSALDVDGNAQVDVVEADSSHDVVRMLASQGLQVSTVVPLGGAGLLPGGLRQLRWDDLRLFSQQLASITRSGYPLAPALKAMAQDLDRPRLRAALEAIHDDVQRGEPLSGGIERQRHRFPQTYGALIRAGESTGDLAGVLQLMTAHASKMTTARHRFMLAMIYPAILFLSTLFVLVNLLLFTIPVFAEIFVGMEAELPAPTRFLLFLSEVFRAYWPAIYAALPLAAAALIGGYLALRQSEGGRYVTDWCKLYLPGIGACYHGAVQARFCHTLGLLLGARVPIVAALDLAGAASGCAVLERRCQGAGEDIARGERLTDSLRYTRFFGHNFIWILGTGEERGGAEEALQNLAESLDRETEAREQALGMFSAPLLTAVFGVVIGFIVWAMYAPIFSLGDQVVGL